MKLKDLEVITAVTFQYQDGIEEKLLNEKDEVLQEGVVRSVYELYETYLRLSIKDNLLSLANNKHIPINQVYK
jgi:archaeosine-15-forming tRNA-guanine transglycosylase